MEALQFDSLKKVLSHISLPKPKITADDELIIEVAFAGLCGTDLHIIKGEFPVTTKQLVLGHEFSGIVREVGSTVTHVQPGDKVVVDPQSWCTVCNFCLSGNYHLCKSGGVFGATGICINGGWAKFAKARARQVYKIPSSISLREGVLCEPISCIAWGLERGVVGTPVGADVAVIGAGIIGNLWSSVLHHLGYRRVTVVEPSLERRKINQSIGTGFETLSPEELSKKKGSELAFDLAIDCSGNGRAIEQAFSYLKPGATLLLFGVAPQETQVKLSPFEIYLRELTIKGTNINRFTMNKAIGLMEAMGKRYLDYQKLGIKEYQMKDHAEAVSALKSGLIAKVVFTVNSNLE